MGDSFAFGVGVDDRQTYVNLLDLKSSLRYLNLGVPGSALPNHLDIIEYRHVEELIVAVLEDDADVFG